MAASRTKEEDFIYEEVKKYEGIAVSVKAGFLERLLVKKVPAGKLHPNPDDEFCIPSVGPSFSIVSKYESSFRRDPGSMEPLTVEKMHPDGYLILNGHHRWLAALKCGIKKIPVEIVNPTTIDDIRKMLAASDQEKRVTFDLDEVVFCSRENEASEKALGFPAGLYFKERLRLGIPALFHYLNTKGYDIWVFSADYYSTDYLQSFFKRYNARVDGVVTGTGKKNAKKTAEKKEIETLVSKKYGETIHIDRDMLIQTFSRTKEFNEYPLSGSSGEWSKEVIAVVEKLK